MPLWESNVRRVSPYVPGAQPQGTDVIKLNTNENPYPPSPKVDKVLKTLDTDRYARYPDPLAKGLRDAIADYHGIDTDRVFVGTGSDDVLSVAFLTFFNSDKPVLFPDITYSFYPVWCELYGIAYEKVALADDFSIDISNYIDSRDKNTGGIVIANPNAPTGMSLSLSGIEKIVSAHPDAVVIIDEAYVDYGGETALPLSKKHDNLLIVRTYSKSRAMAGARIGYAMGCTDIIRAMTDVAQSVNSYTMTMSSLAAGVASIEDDEYFRKRISDVIAERERTSDRLRERGFEVIPSDTNFVFTRPVGISGARLYDMLQRRHIYVRHFDDKRIDDYLRITIGTPEQMDALISAIDDIMKGDVS